MAFLRKGIPYSDVAEHFGLSEARARIIIQQTLPKMLNQLDYFVAWRSWVEQESHLPEAEGRHFFNCVCIVAATEHECNRPTVNLRNFYSGKSKTHCVKSQIAIEPINGNIIHVYSGINGRTHDKKMFDDSKIADLVNNRK